MKTLIIGKHLFNISAAGIFTLVLVLAFDVSAAAQNRSLTVESEPNAVVWLDNVRYGATNEQGKLTIKTIPAGKHTLRIRAAGFKEISQNLLPTQKGSVKISLTKATDEAEIAYQQAENSGSDKDKAAELYEKAVRLRPKYAEAYLGLARVLSDAGDADGALAAIRNARKIRPVYPEASAVEGRIYKENLQEDKAIASFKRAVTEGKGFQPEAQAGLGLLYKERAEESASKNDLDGTAANYAESAKYLQLALKQLSGAPDGEIIYQLLGLIYEKTEKYEQAIKVYEEFLRVFPDSNESDAVRSFIVQIRKRMSER